VDDRPPFITRSSSHGRVPVLHVHVCSDSSLTPVDSDYHKTMVLAPVSVATTGLCLSRSRERRRWQPRSWRDPKPWPSRLPPAGRRDAGDGSVRISVGHARRVRPINASDLDTWRRATKRSGEETVANRKGAASLDGPGFTRALGPWAAFPRAALSPGTRVSVRGAPVWPVAPQAQPRAVVRNPLQLDCAPPRGMPEGRDRSLPRTNTPFAPPAMMR
jgi:hypothetical protein